MIESGGLGAKGRGDHAVGDCRGGPARRSPGRVSRVAGIARRSGSEEGELGGDGLPEHDAAGGPQRCDGGRVLVGAAAPVERCPALGGRVGSVDDVLDAHREAVEGSRPAPLVDGPRLGDRPVRIEVRPGVKSRLVPGDAIEAGADEGLGGDRAGAEQVDGRRGSELLERSRAHGSGD